MLSIYLSRKLTAFRFLQSGPHRSTTFAAVLAFSVMGGRLLWAGPTEYDVKASFLYKFTNYVDWPGSIFTSSSSPFVIGIYGDSDISSPLEELVRGKSVSSHQIVVKHISSASDVTGCAIVFVSASEDFSSIQSKATSCPVLTVGESDDFLDKGGIINYILKDGKVNIRVNNRVAHKANLSISSSLLGIADRVRN